MDYLEFLNMPALPTGRRLFAHKKVLERADPVAYKDLVAHVKKAIAHDQETLQAELSRRGAPRARYGAEAMRLDVLLDRAVNGLDSFFVSFIRVCGADRDPGAAAATVQKTVFPTGVGDITKLAFIQEDEAVAAVLARLAEPDMQALLGKLPGSHLLIDHITTLHGQYHAELHKDDDRPSRGDLVEMQNRGNEYVQGTVILIMAYQVRTGDAITANHLLEAIRRQIQDVRDARRRRRPAVDVNPDTGEPALPGSDDDTGDDGDAAADEMTAEPAETA